MKDTGFIKFLVSFLLTCIFHFFDSYTVLVIKAVSLMKIKGICISIFKKAKLKYIIIFGIMIAIVLMAVSFFLIFKSGSDIKIYSKYDIFNANSYYAEYKLRVFSNKNQNEYEIKEWYKKENEGYKFKFKTQNDNNINFIYEGTDKEINIYSDEQLNKISLSNTIIEKENLISISTFIDMFSILDEKIKNNEFDTNEYCKITETHEDENICYKILFKENSDKKCEICRKYLNGMNIGQIELIINEKTFAPSQYIIYDKSGNAMYDIMYEKFDVNVSFE